MWGLALFAVAQAMRYFGLFYMYASAERLSLVMSIAAIVLLMFGCTMLRKVWVVIAFLLLMLPLPQSFHSTIMLPMQNMATSLAVAGLQTLGYAVVREGNIININGAYVAVAEACNGLRMVTSFLVVSCLVVLIINRSWWEKLVVMLSSLPIALFCNATRLIVTAAAFTAFDARSWQVVFHDFGGYAMMPLAVAVIMAELWFLRKMLTVREEYQPQILVRGSSVNIH
jgi:exosortase